MSIISLILAEMSTHDLQATDQIDHIDHVDHIDHLDHLDHIDQVDHIDHLDHLDHIDQVDHIDHLDHFDHIDQADHIDHVDHFDHVDHTDQIDHDYADHIQDSGTPAPFMLLLSAGLLVFGISGITSYYIIGVFLKFLMFVIAPVASIISIKIISILWKKIAISSHYTIASTRNLLGREGEVVLKVDDNGGVIKIPSNTPMKYEKVNVMPFRQGDVFDREEKVYIVGVRNEILLVDRRSKDFKKN
ncbi:MAG: NfeD family protein [Promethearchaeota archaeon]